MQYLLVFSTTSSIGEARKLADKLLVKKLAACVQISSPIESHYWWEGKRQKDREFQLFIKTKAHLWGQVEKTIKRHHSYSVPEIIAWPISKGSRPYLSWLRKTTQ